MKKAYAFIFSIFLVFTSICHAPSSPAQEPKVTTKNLQLYLYRSAYTLIIKRMVDNYRAINILHERAQQNNDQAMLAHTKPALAEMDKRIQDVCMPLADKVEAGFDEQARLLPDITGTPAPSFLNLFNYFERQCDVSTMPSIERQPDGKIRSTVTLDRASLHIMRLQVLIALNQRTRNAWAEVDRSLDTSGYIYVANARRYAQQTQKIYAECEAADPGYKKFINSGNDLIELRRHKAAFEKICTRVPRPR